MKKFRKEEGFTLVELMVVVLIIGILVAIAIPVFNSAKSNAQRKSCYANQRTLEGAAQTWTAEDDGTTFSYTAAGANSLVPKYVKTNPKCPTNSFGYAMDGTLLVTSILLTENLALTTGEVHTTYR